jgi:hypothetical protein
MNTTEICSWTYTDVLLGIPSSSTNCTLKYKSMLAVVPSYDIIKTIYRLASTAVLSDIIKAMHRLASTTVL